MARRKYQDDAENHERWLVSYADFITLLFAFFVVMYAISSVNEGKYKIFSNSLINAFGTHPVTPGTKDDGALLLLPMQGQPLGAKRRASEALRREQKALTDIARDLQKLLAPLMSEGKVRVTQSARGVSVEINASVLFAPGEARLAIESGQTLSAVARLLKDDTHAIQVEGHTDNVPINNISFPSNWELSAVRASSVIRLFIDNGIAETRLTALGHGANRPVGANDTIEGRARNRRVTVTILSALPDTVTELPTTPK